MIVHKNKYRKKTIYFDLLGHFQEHIRTVFTLDHIILYISLLLFIRTIFLLSYIIFYLNIDYYLNFRLLRNVSYKQEFKNYPYI